MKRRLRKMAEIQMFENQMMNMYPDLLNQVLSSQQEDDRIDASEQPVFRKMIHDTNKYVVEIWPLVGSQVAAFSGKFDNQWNPFDIDFHGIFLDQNTAMNQLRSELQSESDSPDNFF